VLAALAAGWLLLAVALVVTMSRSAIRQTGSNHVNVQAALGLIGAGQTLCQGNEIVPAGTAAVRAYLSPTAAENGTTTVTVRADASGAIVARGAATPGPSRDSITIPVRPVVRDETPASICIATTGGSPLAIGGEPSARPATIDARPLAGDLRLVYLEPRAESWWSFLPTVVARMSAGSRWSGAQAALCVLLLSLAAAGLASWQLARQRR